MFHLDPIKANKNTWAYAFQHEVFDANELADIINYCKKQPKINSKIITASNSIALDETIRSSKISWIDYEEENAWFYTKIANLIEGLNKSCYGFDLLGFEQLQFTEYNAKTQDKYDWHNDMFWGENPHTLTRKLSATLLLNDNFEGGQFEFSNLFATEQPQMKAGSLIVFPSFLAHRVAPMISGVRNSLVCWCVGPKFK
jgi:PKHD-type hydroxylase